MEVSMVAFASAFWVGITLAWITAFIVAFTVLYWDGKIGMIQEKIILGVSPDEIAYYINKYSVKGFRLADTTANDVNKQRIDLRMLKWSLT